MIYTDVLKRSRAGRRSAGPPTFVFGSVTTSSAPRGYLGDARSVATASLPPPRAITKESR